MNLLFTLHRNQKTRSGETLLKAIMHFNLADFAVAMKIVGNTLRRLIIYSGIIILAAIFSGCSSSSAGISGIFTRNGGIFAKAKVFEFDKAPERLKDITPNSAREYGFSTNFVKEGKETCIVAHNRREMPVSVNIRITAEKNLASDREFPLYHVVPPKSDICIARLSPLDKSKDYAFRANSFWRVGNYTARHTPQKGYRVPWTESRSYNVTQAPGGPLTSHVEPFSLNAIDFDMPLGTPVSAARSGIVADIEASYKAGGDDRGLLDKANYIDILHDDGTVASYVHLKENSQVVEIGQRVSQGDKLGLSGSTGYSRGPHLHFSVWTLLKTEKGFERVSLPVEFCFESKPQCKELKYRMSVSTQGAL